VPPALVLAAVLVSGIIPAGQQQQSKAYHGHKAAQRLNIINLIRHHFVCLGARVMQEQCPLMMTVSHTVSWGARDLPLLLLRDLRLLERLLLSWSLPLSRSLSLSGLLRSPRSFSLSRLSLSGSRLQHATTHTTITSSTPPHHQHAHTLSPAVTPFHQQSPAVNSDPRAAPALLL